MVTQMITESVYVTVYCYPNKELFQWDLLYTYSFVNVISIDKIGFYSGSIK